MTCYGNGSRLNNGMGCTAYNTAVYKNNTQILSSGVKTLVDFTTKEAGENPTGFFNLTTDTATIPFSGNWTTTATLEIIISGSGIAYGAIEIDQGAGFLPYSISCFDVFSDTCNLTMAITKYLQATDQIRVYVQQTTGLNATLNGIDRRVNCHITSSCIP